MIKIFIPFVFFIGSVIPCVQPYYQCPWVNQYYTTIDNGIEIWWMTENLSESQWPGIISVKYPDGTIRNFDMFFDRIEAGGPGMPTRLVWKSGRFWSGNGTYTFVSAVISNQQVAGLPKSQYFGQTYLPLFVK